MTIHNIFSIFKLRNNEQRERQEGGGITDEIANVISTVGFPIVAFWLMYQMCKETIGKVTESLDELKIAITELKGRIENDK